VLHEAAKCDNLTTVKLCMQLGAKVECQDDKGQTALHKAAKHSTAALAEYFVQAGADIDVQDNDGRSALVVAIGASSEAVTKFLLSAGAALVIVFRDPSRSSTRYYHNVVDYAKMVADSRESRRPGTSEAKQAERIYRHLRRLSDGRKSVE